MSEPVTLAARIRTTLTILVGVLALAAVVAVPARAADAGSAVAGQANVPVSPGVFAHHTVRQVEDIASFDPAVRPIQDERPSAIFSAVYAQGTHRWTVTLAQPGNSTPLATVVVDDLTGAVVSRHTVGAGPLPSRLTSQQIVAIATKDHRVIRAANQHGGLSRLFPSPTFQNGNTWQIDYVGHSSTQVRVYVSDVTGQVTEVWTGTQIAWSMARGVKGAFGGSENNWYWFWPPFALFLLAMLDPRRLRSLYTLDLVVLLSFVVSNDLFNHALIRASVPTAVPPLVYLFLRCCWLFFRGVPGAVPLPEIRGRLHGLRQRGLPTWAFVVMAVLACAARYTVNGTGSNVIDVGYAGVYGAHDLLHGLLPYQHMPTNNANGDTYGPLNYLFYVPMLLVFGRTTDWGTGLPAAHAATITSDVLCWIALIVIGWRFISRRGAVMLLCGWMLFPYTTYALSSNTNDLLVTAAILWAFAALPRAWLRGG